MIDHICSRLRALWLIVAMTAIRPVHSFFSPAIWPFIFQSCIFYCPWLAPPYNVLCAPLATHRSPSFSALTGRCFAVRVCYSCYHTHQFQRCAGPAADIN